MSGFASISTMLMIFWAKIEPKTSVFWRTSSAVKIVLVLHNLFHNVRSKASTVIRREKRDSIQQWCSQLQQLLFKTLSLVSTKNSLLSFWWLVFHLLVIYLYWIQWEGTLGSYIHFYTCHNSYDWVCSYFQVPALHLLLHQNKIVQK